MTTLPTDLGNGFTGVVLNETLENELQTRYNELDEMNKVSNWTNAMNEREVVLEKEIEDLREVKMCFENAQ